MPIQQIPGGTERISRQLRNYDFSDYDAQGPI